MSFFQTSEWVKVGRASRKITRPKAVDQPSKLRNILGYFYRKKDSSSIIKHSKERVNHKVMYASDYKNKVLEEVESAKMPLDIPISIRDDVTVCTRGKKMTVLATKHEKVGARVHYECKTPETVDASCDTCSLRDRGCNSFGVDECFGTDELVNMDKQLESPPRRLMAKTLAKKKNRLVYSQLLNFLRCKHFMHVRDKHFITTLVADARAWMLKKEFKMETDIDFCVLSMAVTQAFLVNQQELDMRAALKQPVALNHIDHLNATMSGDLGRVSWFRHQSVGHSLATAARRTVLPKVRLNGPGDSV